MQGHSARLQPGECLTEAERTAMLQRLAQIAQAHADGAITPAQAHHEVQALLAPLKRRIKALTRRTHERSVGRG